ncbi:disulfide bond formation protein DsbB [Thalassotalea piscium]
MNFLSNLTTRTLAWQLLALTALGLELAALYFQYVLDLQPCIMCIYQRAAIWAIFFAGVIGSFGAKYLLARISAFALWGTGAIWGLLISLEHVEAQSSAMSFMFSCEFVPNFPSWAPLHEWIPALFAATGDCGDINWHFLGYTMPQWMVANFSAYLAVLAAVIVARLYHKKSL